MTAACAQALENLPEILRESARLDGLAIEELMERTLALVPEHPDPGPPPQEKIPDAAPVMDITLPLYDANGIYVRHVTDHEAQQLVDRGSALGVMTAGWTSDRRNDLPWLSVRLVVPRAVLQYSSASLDHHDAQAVAGELGDSAAAHASRAKVKAWPKVGDERAPRVGCSPHTGINRTG
jgi:hypothetical protein